MYDNSTKNDRKKLEEPITPVMQYIPSFPMLGSRTRRSSREPSTTTCSSSSSLYETTYDNNDQSTYTPGQGAIDGLSNTSALCTYSSDEDSNTDTDLDLDLANTRLSERKSQELFRHDWDDLTGNHSSPTLVKQKKNDDYFSPKENTPIFKRLISKNSLKPQLKSFRRITAELQHESVPLENEINHEKLILLNLQDEEHFLNKSRLNKNDKTINENNHSYKKFDIIKKANESWNQKKHGFSKHNKSEHSFEKGDDVVQDEEDGGEKKLDEAPKISRKRSFDNESISKSKRRAVSSSPISAGFLKRGNFKLMSKASMEFENMSLG